MIFLLILAVVVVLALAAYAIYLQRLVKLQGQEQERARVELDEQAREKREQVNKSIQILADGCKQEQLTLTEASIRIRGLLDSLSVDDAIREEFKAFYQLAAATDHIPYLAEWKKLDAKQQRQFDFQRMKLEFEHREFVLDAASRIGGRSF